MKLFALRPLSVAACLLGFASASLAQTQIADLRLDTHAFPGAFTSFDPGFGPLPTRAIETAVEGVVVTFRGVSQTGGDSAPDGNDIGLRTYLVSTNISQLNRYETESKQGKPVRKVGAVAWSIDLSGLDQTLASRGEQLGGLELRLVLGGAADFKTNLYLSPGKGVAGANALDIGAYSPEDCYRVLWLPAQSRQPGDVIPVAAEGDALGAPTAARESFRLVKTGLAPAGVTTVDLGPDFTAGARKFSLILASGSFGAGRLVEIREGSGLFLTTKPARR